MLVLGINGGHKSAAIDDSFMFKFHDSAAVLLRDGNIVAAIEEERLNRIKHSNCFPANAIRSCLWIGGVSLTELDAIAVNGERSYLESAVAFECLEDAAATVDLDGRAFVARLFDQEFGIDVMQKLSFCHHHLAHAWSSYALSGLPESLVVSIDGLGDGCSGMVLQAIDGTLQSLRKFTPDQSLGLLYVNIIKLLGFNLFDEYKAMGLAPYGNEEVYANLFREGFRLLPEGSYTIDPSRAWGKRFRQAGLLGQARRRGCEFKQVHMDVAAGLQRTIEELVLHVLKHFRNQTGLRKLCLAGGVAHNCTLNGKLLYSGLFDEIFVQPASHDAGGALGAALAVAFQENPRTKVIEMRHVSLGPDIGSDGDIRRELEAWSEFLIFEPADDVAQHAARLIADGAVIGWVQGRSEFGPRALGYRSILADPRPASNKHRINAMVKKRESFRPFGPSVVEERASEFFEIPETRARLSFMTYAVRVREFAKPVLGATTHIDGTARIQTVSRAENPKYWGLLNEFGRITGIPILLNTSFNNYAEPIVQCLHDAIACFLTTTLDYLVAGKWIVRRRMPLAQNPAALRLIPSLAVWARLERRACVAASSQKACCWVVSVKGSSYIRMRQEISNAMFGILARADDRRTIDELIESARPEQVVSRTAFLGEVSEVWASRLIQFRPHRTA